MPNLSEILIDLSMLLTGDIPSRFVGVSSISCFHPYCIIFVDIVAKVHLEDYIPHTIRDLFLNLLVIPSSIDNILAISVLVVSSDIGVEIFQGTSSCPIILPKVDVSFIDPPQKSTF
ncbi:hypothetical protein HAX54_039024 [Datura stramonium]|uniref:Uncharacterized protein n=1 Tax=Datura stramonium TaxID=4076 RepID=A0ABS8VPQ7_DATST|nr:hypothetical protein [Datura stramonium]